MKRSNSECETNAEKVQRYKEVLEEVKSGIANFFDEQSSAMQWSQQRLLIRGYPNVANCGNYKGRTVPQRPARSCLRQCSSAGECPKSQQSERIENSGNEVQPLTIQYAANKRAQQILRASKTSVNLKSPDDCINDIRSVSEYSNLNRRRSSGSGSSMNGGASASVQSLISRPKNVGGVDSRTSHVKLDKIDENQIVTLMKPSPIEIVSCNKNQKQIQLEWRRKSNEEFKSLEVFSNGLSVLKTTDVDQTVINLDAEKVNAETEQLISISVAYIPRTPTDYFFYEMAHYHYFPRRSMLCRLMERRACSLAQIPKCNN